MNDSRAIELASELFADAQALKQIGTPDSPGAATARERILDFAFEIYNLLLDPAELLRTHASHANLISLHFIQRFNIATIVPPDSGISYSTIASACGQLEQTVQRILRHAIGLQIFREEHPSSDVTFVYHTPASLLLRDPSFGAWMGATCEESWPAATRTVDALTAFPSASEPTESGWALAHSTPPFPTGISSASDQSSSDGGGASPSPPRQSLYDIIACSPARAARFSTGMSAYSSGPGYAPDHFVRARGDLLARLPKGSEFVDVGGGLGHFARALRESKQCQHLDFVVQDLEKVVCRAGDYAGDLQNDGSHGHPKNGNGNGNEGQRQGQIVFQAHDFFTPQPVKGAAVYFLRWILHNWSDEYAVRILRNIGQAMSEKSRLIIHDYCIEDLDKLSLRKKRAATNMDIGMMQLLNARERDEAQWKELLAKADSRFQWIGVTRPPGSALAIIEASWGEI
ncbi:S-adenosyl-L-methionine-dependent methyltransferase [Annulohypoxylon truncatum]|uniref:S-adenosyl-L-methionine-dependent methyltransferase n=1 Tax=Annulohypoxylon truncatum TaxID=327061 RepID=UPI00200865A5|nr:S-adenosyl-L-methionine-dependent methyltransferase [Annulohypoxylon truncatum]KAI1212599.1 S-adenosyl-L-methionine-dependent methyltransferase [Annulohypoxylon truncatum]